MTKKSILAFVLALTLACSTFAVTPAKPYPDLADGDVLSSVWLMGTFNVIYAWAQGFQAKFPGGILGLKYGGTNNATYTAGELLRVSLDGTKIESSGVTVASLSDIIGAAGAVPYDISGFIPGTIPNGNLVCFMFVAPRAISFPSGMTGSRTRSRVQSWDQSDFGIFVNGSQVGTMTFPASSGTIGSITGSGVISLAEGDTFVVLGPALGDTDLADIAFTFKGTAQ